MIAFEQVRRRAATAPRCPRGAVTTIQDFQSTAWNSRCSPAGIAGSSVDGAPPLLGCFAFLSFLLFSGLFGLFALFCVGFGLQPGAGFTSGNVCFWRRARVVFDAVRAGAPTGFSLEFIACSTAMVAAGTRVFMAVDVVHLAQCKSSPQSGSGNPGGRNDTPVCQY